MKQKLIKNMEITAYIVGLNIEYGKRRKGREKIYFVFHVRKRHGMIR